MCSLVRLIKEMTMVELNRSAVNSPNRLDCGELNGTSAVHSLDKWVNASGITTVHENAYHNAVAGKEKKIPYEFLKAKFKKALDMIFYLTRL